MNWDAIKKSWNKKNTVHWRKLGNFVKPSCYRRWHT
jgi:hypothetical protein